MLPHKRKRLGLVSTELEADIVLTDLRNRGIKATAERVSPRRIAIHPVTKEDLKKALAYEEYRASFMPSRTPPRSRKVSSARTKTAPSRLGRMRVVKVGGTKGITRRRRVGRR